MAFGVTGIYIFDYKADI